MRNEDAPAITGPIAVWNDGDAGALDRLVDLVYLRFQDLLRLLGLLP